VIVMDHVIGPVLTNNVMFGNGPQLTSRPLVIDSEAYSVVMTDFEASDIGLGAVIQNTFGGANLPPQWLFFSQVQMDCAAAGDTLLFDSSLGVAQINFSADDSWFSGGGNNCRSGVTGIGNGVHISGGQIITLGPMVRMRANTANGVLIDSANVAHVKIIDNPINGNNWGPSSNGNYSGITVSTAVTDLLIDGNSFDNTMEGAFGLQKYAINLLALGSQQTVTNNSCTSAVIGCYSSFPSNINASNNRGVDASGDAQVAFTNLAPFGFRLTPKTDGTGVLFCGSDAANSTCKSTIFANGTASFVGIPTVGTPTVGNAACIKSAGPPVVIGYCSTVVSSSGACTCN
jgi:hypothetical protein